MSLRRGLLPDVHYVYWDADVCLHSSEQLSSSDTVAEKCTHIQRGNPADPGSEHYCLQADMKNDRPSAACKALGSPGIILNFAALAFQ
jgi:hypothetical protein